MKYKLFIYIGDCGDFVEQSFSTPCPISIGNEIDFKIGKDEHVNMKVFDITHRDNYVIAYCQFFMYYGKEYFFDIAERLGFAKKDIPMLYESAEQHREENNQ